MIDQSTSSHVSTLTFSQHKVRRRGGIFPGIHEDDLVPSWFVVVWKSITLFLSLIPGLFAITSATNPSWMRHFTNHICRRLLIHEFVKLRQGYYCHNRFRMSTSTHPDAVSVSTSTTDSVQHMSNGHGVVKDVWIIRHGQAVHNPRAEYARDVLKCSHAEFLQYMEEDDCFDAPLTDLGIQQAQELYNEYRISINETSSNGIGLNAEQNEPLSPTSSTKRVVELVVSSPLSRALRTAELALGDDDVNTGGAAYQSTRFASNRVCYEGFREINGWLLNGKRHTRTQLEATFPRWNFSLLSTNEDVQWTVQLETVKSCMERGYNGLLWMMKERPEQSILLVSHGALLKYTLTEHPNVILRDGRQQQHTTNTKTMIDKDNLSNTQDSRYRCIQERFHNGEIRRYRMEARTSSRNETDNDTVNDCDIIVMTEIDL
jgi:broad specificity phosphatase PhoE